MSDIIVGIDLGTTYSSVYIYDETQQRVNPIVFKTGKKSIASCVNFNPKPVHVGIPVPDGVSEVKRLIGLKYNDPKVQETIAKKSFPYEVQEDKEGYCSIIFKPKNRKEIIELSPEEVSAIILKEIRNQILTTLNKSNDQKIYAVVTVPAHFSQEQKQRTQDAVEMSGLELICMLQEPSAAAYAYKQRKLEAGYYLAFDLGGGTFDLSLMKVNRNGTIDFVTKSGDCHLGGLDFDTRFTLFALKKWESVDPNHKSHIFLESESDTRTKRNIKRQKFFNLRKKVEEVKIALSTQNEVLLSFNDFCQDEDDHEIYLSRKEFEECNQDYFQKCIDLIDEMFREKGLSKDIIKQVFLIGGSSQIPKIRSMLRNYFSSSVHFNDEIDCNEVVAMGAAFFAFNKFKNHSIDVNECNSHAIRIKGLDCIQDLIRKDEVLPHEHDFYVEITGTDAETELYERKKNQNTNTMEDVLLGKYYLQNIPSNEKYFRFVVSIGVDGILRVSGNLSNGNQVQLSCSIERKMNDVQEKMKSRDRISKFFEK